MEKRRYGITSFIYLILGISAIVISCYHKDNNGIIFSLIIALSIILLLTSGANLAAAMIHNDICDDLEYIEEDDIQLPRLEEYEEGIFEFKEYISIINVFSFVITLIIAILLILLFVL